MTWTWPNAFALGLGPPEIARRRLSIGASDANIILGNIDERKLRLWREKRGEVAPENMSDKFAPLLGLWTEELQRQWFARETGHEVRDAGMVVFRDGEPPMSATLDGMVYADNEALGPLEVKHVNARCSPEEAWARYVPQVAHQCLVTRRDRGWLSVICGSSEPVVFEYAVNGDYAAALLDAETAFWACVQSGEPPVPLPPPTPPKPVGVKEYDMAGSNAWPVWAADLIRTAPARRDYERAKAEIKLIVPDDASRAFGSGVEVRRDKRGAMRLLIQGEEA